MKNYNQIKNYMHNELGITKDYIDSLIVKTIREEIKKIFNDKDFVSDMFKNHVVNTILSTDYSPPLYKTITDINGFIYDNVIQELCSTVHNNIKIRVGLKTDNLEITDLDNNVLEEFK